MHTASRFEFQPHEQREGRLRSIGFALLVHGLLLTALTWGVGWRRHDQSLAVEAELWSAVPQEAARRGAEPEPEPVRAPTPPKAEHSQPKDAELALERERQAKEKAAQLKREEERRRREKEEHERKLAEEKKRKELEAKRKAQEEEKLREKLRQENLQRMTGLATGTGTAKSTAQQSSGPSASYAGRIRGRIKPNIVFPDELTTNPSAEVEVRTSPDGTIVGRKLLKSSGVPTWDDAVLKAIDKTETLPRDVDGLVPSALIITFRPKD